MAGQRPQWQPLSMLPTLGPYLEGMLATYQEQYDTLLEAKPKPHVLDNYTVDRVISTFTTQRETLNQFDEQIRRWSTEPKLTTAQRTEIAKLKQLMTKLHKLSKDVLALADELKQGTIENIMNMDDAELGLRFLLGELPGQQDRRR
jgi:hypothetical protein